jgi:hypothetical protein
MVPTERLESKAALLISRHRGSAGFDQQSAAVLTKEVVPISFGRFVSCRPNLRVERGGRISATDRPTDRPTDLPTDPKRRGQRVRSRGKGTCVGLLPTVGFPSDGTRSVALPVMLRPRRALRSAGKGTEEGLALLLAVKSIDYSVLRIFFIHSYS